MVFYVSTIGEINSLFKFMKYTHPRIHVDHAGQAHPFLNQGGSKLCYNLNFSRYENLYL